MESNELLKDDLFWKVSNESRVVKLGTFSIMQDEVY